MHRRRHKESETVFSPGASETKPSGFLTVTSAAGCVALILRLRLTASGQPRGIPLCLGDTFHFERRRIDDLFEPLEAGLHLRHNIDQGGSAGPIERHDCSRLDFLGPQPNPAAGPNKECKTGNGCSKRCQGNGVFHQKSLIVACKREVNDTRAPNVVAHDPPLHNSDVVNVTTSSTARRMVNERGQSNFNGCSMKRCEDLRHTLLHFALTILVAYSVGSRHTADAQAADVEVAPQPTGVLVNIGGQRLHIDCRGSGSPTVLLEAGAGDVSVIWSLVQPLVARSTRTCSYDRGGYAWSDPGTTPRTFAQLSAELHSALDSLRIHGPFILVGQSYGGFVVRGFAKQYPQDVAGMVLVDAVHEDQRLIWGGEAHRISDAASGRPFPSPVIGLNAALLSQARQLPIDTSAAQLQPPLDRLPPFARSIWAWAESRPLLRLAQAAEMEWSPEELAVFHAERAKNRATLGSLPLVVLARADGGYKDLKTISAAALERERRALQADLARLSTRGQLSFVANSGHNIHVEAPDAVVKAIETVIGESAPRASYQTSPLWGSLKNGRYPVGFTVLNRRDELRKDSAGLARPIQISVWYPAADASSGNAMRFSDYYLLTASQRTLIEPDSAAKSAAVRGFSGFLMRAGSSARAADQWLQSPVTARREARRANHRFPIVLLAQGSYEAAYSQAILAEFLASHGFVVATSPAPLLLESEGAARRTLLDLARIQAADLSFVLSAVASAGFADSARSALVAHSFGARSAFLLMTSRHFEGLVSLDGGIANRQGREWLDSANVNLSNFASPILHFYQDVDSTVTPDFTLLERVSAADRTIAKVDTIYHLDFTSVGFARAAFPELAVAPPSPFLTRKTATIAEMTLGFLRRVMNGDSRPSKALLQFSRRRSPIVVVRAMPADP